MKTILKAVLCALAIAQPFTAKSQTPPEPEPPAVVIKDVKLETASLPGSSLKWIKIIATFTTEKPWLDGILFSSRVLLSQGESLRVVSGNVRYANVPAGTHNAIFYLSPRAAQRFGAPMAVEVQAFHNDQESSEKVWKNPNFTAKAVDWNTINTYPNILVNVSRTPWILIDYEKSPDLAGN
jgi:hypothetical protein